MAVRCAQPSDWKSCIVLMENNYALKSVNRNATVDETEFNIS